MKNYLIFNIDTRYRQNLVQIQVNKRDDVGMCYNLTFEKADGYIVCRGFLVPTFSGSYLIPINGNSDSRAMVHCLKVLPKIMEDKTDIILFIAALIKKEKLNNYQLNVNGNMDYSAARPIDLGTLIEIRDYLVKYNFPLEF